MEKVHYLKSNKRKGGGRQKRMLAAIGDYQTMADTSVYVITKDGQFYTIDCSLWVKNHNWDYWV